MNHHKLLTLIQTCQAILTFLVNHGLLAARCLNHGLLAARRRCSCGDQIVLRDDKSDDVYHWECPVNQFRKQIFSKINPRNRLNIKFSSSDGHVHSPPHLAMNALWIFAVMVSDNLFWIQGTSLRGSSYFLRTSNNANKRKASCSLLLSNDCHLLKRSTRSSGLSLFSNHSVAFVKLLTNLKLTLQSPIYSVQTGR